MFAPFSLLQGYIIQANRNIPNFHYIYLSDANMLALTY